MDNNTIFYIIGLYFFIFLINVIYALIFTRFVNEIFEIFTITSLNAVIIVMLMISFPNVNILYFLIPIPIITFIVYFIYHSRRRKFNYFFPLSNFISIYSFLAYMMYTEIKYTSNRLATERILYQPTYGPEPEDFLVTEMPTFNIASYASYTPRK